MEVIFKTLVGSKLYNLHTEDSDTDIKGVFFAPKENMIPSLEQTLGLKQFTPMNRVETVVGEGKDKVETVLYSAKYFIEMFIKSNPTITELPYCSKEFVTSNKWGDELMRFVRENLITKHIFSSYYGYFKDQVRGFEKKTGKCREKRQELIDKFGFDTKMAGHSYRIAIQGIELFATGKFNPTMQGEQREIAMGLRQGKYTREWLIETLNKLNEELKDSINNSPLPESPDVEKTHQFILDFNKRYYK
jgi:predicted nucleotidyltransferase